MNIRDKPIWLPAFRALWTSVCLAVLESLLVVLLQEALYFAEGAITGYITGVEGVSPPIDIVHDYLFLLQWRLLYAFIGVTAMVLLAISLLGLRFHWATLGYMNLTLFLILSFLWKEKLPLFDNLTHFSLPLYKNVVCVQLLVMFVSPMLLLKAGLWGSCLPITSIQGNQTD